MVGKVHLYTCLPVDLLAYLATQRGYYLGLLGLRPRFTHWLYPTDGRYV